MNPDILLNQRFHGQRFYGHRFHNHRISGYG